MAMPILSLLRETAFDPETTALLASAFDIAWGVVKKSGNSLAADDQAASTREVLAKRIIDRAQQGERDPKRLVDDALVHLARSK
jgi:hypothetical protein